MDAEKRSAEDPQTARQTLSSSVSAELEAIFHPPKGAAPPAGSSAVRGFGGARTASQPHGRAARLGALAAAALVGLGVGAAVMDRRAPEPRPAPQATRSVPVVVAQRPEPPAPAAAADPLPAPVWPATPGPIAVTGPAAEPRPQAAKAVAKTKRSAAKIERAADGRCETLRGANRARCAYPQVLAADRKLRRAYAQATRAGVERARLVSYRNRWASLRHRADEQPMRVIAAYSDMAQDLSRLAREARS
jgi:type IV secretory pathway VirB10-like protein